MDTPRPSKLRRTFAAFLVAGALVMAGCGGDDSVEAEKSLELDGGAKQNIAATVNAYFARWTAGDGPGACALLTDRGARRLVRLAPVFSPGFSGASCEEAVAATADAPPEGEAFGQSVSLDQVQLEGSRAEVISEFRGSVSVRKVGGEWRIDTPNFFD